MTPLVSLITPTFQAGRFLGEYLDSVLAQTFSDMEFILVDDGSTDHSETIARSFAARFERKGVRFISLRQEHAGQSSAFNLALPMVRGKYLAWADSDDILHPDNLRFRVEYMENTPDCSLLRCNALEVLEESGAVLKESARPGDKKITNIFKDLFLGKTYCLAGCYMLTTALFRTCYPTMRIPESIVGQNLQLLLPPASRADCHYLDAVLLTYRRRRDSHYHGNTTLKGQLERSRALSVLLRTLTAFSDCDTDAYRKLALEQEKQDIARIVANAIVQNRAVSEKGETP